MQREIDPAWVADGCAEVRRLVDQGHGEAAAVMAAHIEARALGREPQFEPPPLETRCSLCGRRRVRGMPWCLAHRPEFVTSALAMPSYRFWWVLRHARKPEKRRAS